MTQLSPPYMTQTYLHQQGQQLKLRAKRHHVIHENRAQAGRRTNRARRPRALSAKVAAATYSLRTRFAS
jgi:hypothetical protein